MIGNITKGACFNGCVEYALALKEKNKEARLLAVEGLMTDSPKSIVDGFECQRGLNMRVEKCVGHISLSYSPEDSARLTDDAMVSLAQEYMQRMGIVNTQYIIVRHLDKEHPHCHIVYNRVNNDGKCISDSHDYDRNKDICRELKLEYGLTFGNDKDNVKTHRLKGRDKTRQEIYLAVRDAKKTAKDWLSFQRELAKSGVTVKKKFRRGSDEVQGLSFLKDGRKFKASEVDKNGKCSYKTICAALEANKRGAVQTPVAAHRIINKPEPAKSSVIVKAMETDAEIAESVGNAVGGLFQVGPGYDAQEEEFRRQMQRKKRKRNGPKL